MKRGATNPNTAARAMALLRKEKIARNIAEIEELARTISFEDYLHLREQAFANLEAVEKREMLAMARITRSTSEEREKI